MSAESEPLALIPSEVIQHSGMFLAMGISLTCLAVVAWIRSGRALLHSVYFFGWLLILACAIEAFDAYLTGGWSGFYIHLVGAILFGVTGGMLLLYSKAGTESTTFIVAMYFLIAGIFNIIIPLVVNVPDRGWHVWAGFITLMLGPALLGNWTGKKIKVSEFRLIGIFIGIDLFFRGLAFAFLALDLRSR